MVADRAAQTLYDGACELLHAARLLRDAARSAGAEEAIPATLGCIGAVLELLSASSAELGARLAESHSERGPGEADGGPALRELGDALWRCERACEAARAAAAEDLHGFGAGAAVDSAASGARTAARALPSRPGDQPPA